MVRLPPPAELDGLDDEHFRQVVRAFLRAHYPEHLRNPPKRLHWSENKEWYHILAREGWLCPGWPREHGGLGLSPIKQIILSEEYERHGVARTNDHGIVMLGPLVIKYGTEEQKQRFLPKILTGEHIWCQGYSEPNAGSDLAALRTEAVPDGDHYVVNGQKIWTTGAHRADWMFMLARTDPDAPKHRGISMLLVDMKSEGLQVQPLITMSGEHVFNQEFFDGVRVPAQNLVGEENRGWYIGAALLDFERSNIATAIGLKHSVMDLATIARGGRARARADREQVRNHIADRMVEASVARLISYRVIDIQRRGGIPNYEASMNKLYGSEVGQRIAATGVELLGMYGGVMEESKYGEAGRIPLSYLATVASTIAAGTSEVNRSVIATRGLGLPRS